MLQIDKAKSVAEPLVQAPDVIPLEQLYREFVAFVNRQFPVIIFIVLLTLGLAVLYIFTTPPRYTGEAVLIIDTHQINLFQQQSPINIDAPVDTAMVDSQVEILKSENIALSVIKDLHLVDDPEFIGPRGGLFGAVIDLVANTMFSLFGPDEPNSEYVLTRKALERFEDRLTIKRVGLTYVIDIDYESLDPAKAAKIANAIADAYVTDALEAKYQSTKRAAIWLQDRLKELRAQATAADHAVVDYKEKHNIVDTGGRLLNEQQLAELNSALVMAQAQTAEAQAKMERVQQILQKESGSSNFTDTATVTDTLHDDVITRLRQQYLDIAAREADWAARYGQNHLAVVNLRNQMQEIRRSIDDELRRIAETYKSDYEIAQTHEEAVQKGLNNIVVQSNQTNQAQITLRDLDSTAQSYRAMADNFLQQYMMSVQQQSFPITESRLITEATPPLKKSHPKTLLLLAIATAGGLLLALGIGKLRDISDRVFRTASQVETLLQTDCIAVLPFLKPMANLEVSDSSPVSKATKTMTGSLGASTRGHMNIHDKLRHVLFSQVSRLFERVRSIKILDTLFSVGRSDRDIRIASAKLTEGGLNVKNSDSMSASKGSRNDLISGSAAIGARTIARDNSILWHVLDSPFSRFSESMRSIKIASDLFNVSKSNKIIGMTSTLPNEGKSTVAASLAQMATHGGGKVILVDCDIRNPVLSRQFAPNARFGLVEVLSGEAALDDVVWSDPSTGLIFLPTVMKTRIAHTSDILASNKMKNLMDTLRQTYDFVVVDLSPLAPVVDVRATTHMVDSYIFVIEWGRTKIDFVEHALSAARSVYDNLLGVVLNKANVEVLNRYEGYRGSYYYKRYYARYGYTE